MALRNIRTVGDEILTKRDNDICDSAVRSKNDHNGLR